MWSLVGHSMIDGRRIDHYALLCTHHNNIFVLCVGMKVKQADVLIDVNDVIPTCVTLILTSGSQSWLLTIFRYQGFAKKLFFLTYPYVSVSNKFTCSRILKRPNRLLKYQNCFCEKYIANLKLVLLCYNRFRTNIRRVGHGTIMSYGSDKEITIGRRIC